MHKVLAAIAALLLTLSVAACGSSELEPEAVTVTSSVSPSATKSTTAASSSTEETSTEFPEPEAPVESLEQQAEAVVAEQSAVQGPTFVRCQMANGTALMSDGTETYMESCDENAGGLVPGNVDPSTYTEEDLKQQQAIADWYANCVEQYGIDDCVVQLNSQPGPFG